MERADLFLSPGTYPGSALALLELHAASMNLDGILTAVSTTNENLKGLMTKGQARAR
jgi:hypothetical protein